MAFRMRKVADEGNRIVGGGNDSLDYEDPGKYSDMFGAQTPMEPTLG